MSFIDKCIDLLEDEGELIFIIPSDYFETTSSKKNNIKMFENGVITDIFKPECETLFVGASVDVIIFRYVKTTPTVNINRCVNYNNEIRTCIINNSLIQFVEIQKEYIELSYIKDFFNIYVGIVSGKEEVYHNNEFGNINILSVKDIYKKYIYIKNFPTLNNELNQYLLKNKDILMSRKIKKFKESNWFEWGVLRNIKVVEDNIGKKCIYVKNITRSISVAFISTVSYFSGNLLMLLPLNDDIDLLEIVNIINKNRNRYIFSNRFKITHKQLSNFIL